jgi:hypothetical protein
MDIVDIVGISYSIPIESRSQPQADDSQKAKIKLARFTS